MDTSTERLAGRTTLLAVSKEWLSDPARTCRNYFSQRWTGPAAPTLAIVRVQAQAPRGRVGQRPLAVTAAIPELMRSTAKNNVTIDASGKLLQATEVVAGAVTAGATACRFGSASAVLRATLGRTRVRAQLEREPSGRVCKRTSIPLSRLATGCGDHRSMRRWSSSRSELQEPPTHKKNNALRARRRRVEHWHPGPLAREDRRSQLVVSRKTEWRVCLCLHSTCERLSRCNAAPVSAMPR